MSKELEAWQRIVKYGGEVEDYQIVEEALKRLEKIETTTYSVLREDISKKLKALEIIKNKTLSIIRLRLAENLEHYNLIMIERQKLTHEEYNLLKEVLL